MSSCDHETCMFQNKFILVKQVVAINVNDRETFRSCLPYYYYYFCNEKNSQGKIIDSKTDVQKLHLYCTCI